MRTEGKLTSGRNLHRRQWVCKHCRPTEDRDRMPGRKSGIDVLWKQKRNTQLTLSIIMHTRRYTTKTY